MNNDGYIKAVQLASDVPELGLLILSDKKVALEGETITYIPEEGNWLSTTGRSGDRGLERYTDLETIVRSILEDHKQINDDKISMHKKEDERLTVKLIALGDRGHR